MILASFPPWSCLTGAKEAVPVGGIGSGELIVRIAQ